MSGIRDIWVFTNNIIQSSRQLVNERLKPLGLRSSEGNILLHLLTQGDVFCQDELVEQLDISKPAVSRALESLEKKGYVNRKRDGRDRRFQRVFLTEKAHKVGPKIEDIYDEVLAVATQDLSEHEIQSAIQVFKRVSESMNQVRIRERGMDHAH